jgi:hypothetical protein
MSFSNEPIQPQPSDKIVCTSPHLSLAQRCVPRRRSGAGHTQGTLLKHMRAAIEYSCNARALRTLSSHRRPAAPPPTLARAFLVPRLDIRCQSPATRFVYPSPSRRSLLDAGLKSPEMHHKGVSTVSLR